MSFFVFRLVPPRPSFAADMSEDEQRVMGAHTKYWRGCANAGSALVFGPVADPAGVWGLAVVEAEDAGAAQRLADSDPAVTSGTCRMEVLPMLGTVLRGDLVPALG